MSSVVMLLTYRIYICKTFTDIFMSAAPYVMTSLFTPPDLFIERFCMTGGSSPTGYLKAWHTNLYLSADADKVREALAEGERALPFQHF